jgi:hypothetical protein
MFESTVWMFSCEVGGAVSGPAFGKLGLVMARVR